MAHSPAVISDAVQRLNLGESASAIAHQLNVSVPTVYRWRKEAILQQQKAINETDPHIVQRVADTLQSLSAEKPKTEVIQQLELFRQERHEARSYLSQLGKDFLQKAIARLQDLPDEAITPALVPAYADTALRLIKYAHEGWAEDIQVSKLLEQLVQDDAGQKPTTIKRVIVDPTNGTTDQYA